MKIKRKVFSTKESGKTPEKIKVWISKTFLNPADKTGKIPRKIVPNPVLDKPKVFSDLNPLFVKKVVKDIVSQVKTIKRKKKKK